MSYRKFDHDENYVWNVSDVADFIGDVCYSSLSDYNKLDLYLPKDDQPKRGAVIYIHGGGFIQGDKTHHISGILHALLEGWAVVCVNYRLKEEAKYPAYLQDVCEAIRFLKAHAKTYKLDPDKFVLWGDTHGGYIASRIAIDEPKGLIDLSDSAYPGQDCSVKGVISFYGPMDQKDFLDYAKKAQDPGQQLLYEMSMKYIYNDEQVQAHLEGQNPIMRIDGSECPFYLLHGRKDFNIPQKYTQQFSDQLSKYHVDHVLDFVEDGLHAIDTYDTPEKNGQILDFIHHVLD
jgi:acetyl esterase/lipase